MLAVNYLFFLGVLDIICSFFKFCVNLRNLRMELLF